MNEQMVSVGSGQTSDFFTSHLGTAKPLTSVRARLMRALDIACGTRLRLGSGLREVRRKAAKRPPARILIVGIEVPSRAADIGHVIDALAAGSRHQITRSVTMMLDQGKFANIDKAIAEAAVPLADHDWLVITDDDIDARPGLLDDLIAIADQADLALSQPAHAFNSYTTYEITRRRCGSLARRTDFVEIGPLTLVRRDLFSEFIPFPPSRWCYGIDLVWSETARRLGRRIGIVDGVPVRHLRPVAGTYSMDAAWDEGHELLKAHDIRTNRAELFARDEVVLYA
jgi:hypothetical protein